jgi:hypothetical protein
MEVPSGASFAPIFVSIEASSYSGATLLAFLLGSHPQIATVGEMNGLISSEDPDAYLCSCGERIKACQFWHAVAGAMRRRGFEFDVAHFGTGFSLGGPRAIHYLRMGSSRNRILDSIRDIIFQSWPQERRQLKALVSRNVALIESVLEVSGKRVFVDTSKDRMRLNALRRFSALDIRAIHLVRDARGVVASRLRRGVGIDAREAARQWVRLHRRLEVTLSALPVERRMLVRYEDVCQDVPGMLRKLYHFCGVDPDVDIANFRAMSHHIVGNPMRLKQLSEIRLDERWRSLLTGEQIDQISQVAAQFLRHYGY